ncbi:MAG: uridine kinase [Gemmatimonadota bacterium]|nr:uridine kinase [Gemmatimonadota bacterium]
MPGQRPLILGVAGGSGSGKTTVVSQIMRVLHPTPVSVLHHDSYYRDHHELTLEQRARINYDHPDSLETPLLAEHLRTLLADEAVEEPVYDFTTHRRTADTRRIEPNPIVILDGILILAEPELRELMDIRVYVETDSDLRFIRRLLRDTKERGRTVESVIRQYQETVRPMHLQFVEPSRRDADIIVPFGRENRVAISMLVARLRARVSENT